MLATKRQTGLPFIDTALGWTVDTRGGGEIIWKNGGTGGYSSFIGYAPRRGVGIVALSNAQTPGGVDDLGLHLLDARYPLAIPAGSPREAAVDAKLLDRYVGHYEMSPSFILSVTREGAQLYVQATGQTRAAIYSKSDREFFYKIVDAQISFQVDDQDQVTALVLHQGGRDQSAKRIGEADAGQMP
jgi:serine-type D-Ala-D-Ala carboxypeptidase/endopeptidase